MGTCVCMGGGRGVKGVICLGGGGCFTAFLGALADLRVGGLV